MQLIGIAALFLAAKYEEITVPAVEDLVYISAASFKESDLYEMEREMFRTIGFDISRPISLNFLRRYSKAAYVSFFILSVPGEKIFQIYSIYVVTPIIFFHIAFVIPQFTYFGLKQCILTANLALSREFY